ncbi:MAG: uroporphyrinogen decarboxylase family protein [Anaerolineae bacterium]
MRLLTKVRTSPSPLVMPLVGQPAVKLTGSSLWQNESNAELQYRTIKALYEYSQPDSVFTMMDLAVEAGALGLPLRFPLNEPPTVEAVLVKRREDIERLHVVDVRFDGRVHTYVQTMHRLAADADIPVPKGAYVAGPFSLAGLMMGATEIAMATLTDPDLVHEAVAFATSVVASYAQMLHAAGADMIVILEPSAVFLSPKAFATFSGAYVRRLVASLETDWLLHVCGDSTHLIRGMCETGVRGLSLDADVDLPSIAQEVPEDVLLVGNLHPVHVVAHGTPETVRAATTTLLDEMREVPNFVLSTGCDVPYEAPLENVKALVDAGKGIQRASRTE